jgi:hypothetical protein
VSPPKAAERCGEPAGRWGERGPCVRPKGHPGVHNSAGAASNQRIYMAQRYKKRRAALGAIKLESGCVDCGYREDPCALDFDHRDPELKISSVPKLINLDGATVLKEIAKCDVRCANCHRIRTIRKQYLGFRAHLAS